MDAPNARLIELIDGIIDLLCVAFVVYLAIKGPTRHLKIALVVFVVAFVGVQALKLGWLPAATMLATILVLNVVAMMVTVLLLRYPIKKALLPLEGESWPKYATKQVEEYTRAFEELGFRSFGDCLSTWRMAGKDKRTFIRLMSHPSGSCWVEVHALEGPRLVARSITSTKEGGAVASTYDVQANEEFFHDPSTRVQRVPRASRCKAMLVAHEAFAMKSPGATRRVEDPPAASAAAHDRWVERLLESRQVVSKGKNFAIPLRRTFPTALRVMAAWFH